MAIKSPQLRKMVRLALHVGFWSLYLYLIVSFLLEWLPLNGIDSTNFPDIVCYSLLYLSHFLVIVYLNVEILVPKLHRKGRHWSYIGSLIGLILVLSMTKIMLDIVFFDRYLTRSDQPEWVFTIGHFFSIVPNLLLFLLFSHWLGQLKPGKSSVEKPILNSGHPPDEHPVSSDEKDIMLRIDGKVRKVEVSSILYVEGLKQYVKVHTTAGALITLNSIKNLQNELKADGFVRVHKSYLVSKRAITALSSNQIEINQTVIPVGRTYREHFMVLKKSFINPVS